MKTRAGEVLDGHVYSGDAWAEVFSELETVRSLVSNQSIAAAAGLLTATPGRIFVTGQGRSGLAGEMGAMRLMHTGRDCRVVGEPTAPSIREGDCLIVVSGSGATPVSLEFADIARREKAKVLAITRSKDSPLGQVADLTLEIPVGPSTQFGGSLFEEAALVVMDAVVYAIAACNPEVYRTMRYRHTNFE